MRNGVDPDKRHHILKEWIQKLNLTYHGSMQDTILAQTAGIIVATGVKSARFPKAPISATIA